MRKATLHASVALTWAIAVGIARSVAPADSQLPDETVAARVRLALVNANVPEVREIEIRAFNGEVDLSGVVDSDDRKAEIARIVGAVKGVAAVHNTLGVRDRASVREDSVDDSTIARKVGYALNGTAEPTSHSIRVVCTNGVVQLDGVVPSSAARDKAELLARSVTGVTQVVNRLEIE
jgi:hyperosmotically inducible periplasmic protein